MRRIQVTIVFDLVESGITDDEVDSIASAMLVQAEEPVISTDDDGNETTTDSANISWSVLDVTPGSAPRVLSGRG